MKKIVSLFMSVFFLYLTVTYFMQSNYFSGVLMIIAMLLWMPLPDFVSKKLFRKLGWERLQFKIIISVVLLLGAGVRIIF